MTTAMLPTGIVRGPEGLPEHTLGWQALTWAQEWLFQPDGPEAGRPWQFTEEQARFVAWFYAIDGNGRFLYRRAMLRRLKGWGKDPLAAVIAAIEFLGPCRFSHWDDGPVAVPHSAAWVQVAAVSREQTKNTMTLFPGLFKYDKLEPSPVQSRYNLDVGKEIIYAASGRCRIEAVTSSPTSMEGGRATFIIKNETQHWKHNNDGHAMSEVIARNAAKSRDGGARSLAISNAHAPGEGSDAERDWEAYQLGTKGLLYDSREAPDVPDLRDTEALKEAIRFARGDSHWLDVDRLVDEIQDPTSLPNTSRRFYLNQIAASDEKAFDAEQWGKLKGSRDVPDGALITLGFDGSSSRDHTALIATEVETGFQWVAGYWEPRRIGDNTIIDVAGVVQTVDYAFERWEVWKLLADPYYWKEQIVGWQGKYNRPGEKRVEEFNTTQYRKMAIALGAYRDAMASGELKHDGDARFTRAIENAHRLPMHFVDDDGEAMWIIQKERPDSPLKIDAAVAGALSWWARLLAVADGMLEQDTSWVMR